VKQRGIGVATLIVIVVVIVAAATIGGYYLGTRGGSGGTGGGGVSEGVSVVSCTLTCENVYYESGFGNYGTFVLDLYLKNNGSSPIDIYSANVYSGTTLKIAWQGYTVDGEWTTSSFRISPSQTRHITSSSGYNLSTAGYQLGQTYYWTLKVQGLGTTTIATHETSVSIPYS